MKRINLFITIFAILGLAACTSGTDEPNVAPEDISSTHTNRSYELPDLSVEIDEDWLSASEINIYDNRDEYCPWNTHDPADEFFTRYNRHYVGYERNKENIDTLFWASNQKLTDYRIVAAWISGPNVNDKVQALDIEPAQTVTVDQRDAEATVTNEYISFKFGSPEQLGSYKIGFYIVAFKGDMEVRGEYIYHVSMATHPLGSAVPGVPYHIAESDPGFELGYTKIIEEGIFAGGDQYLFVPAAGGYAKLALDTPRAVSPSRLNESRKYEVNGDICSMSSPEINLELYTLNKSNGEMTIKMFPNISGARLKFDIKTAQRPNADEKLAPNVFTIYVIQAEKN